MDYQQIRDFLTFFFRERLAILQQQIAEQGRLTESHKQAIRNSQTFAADALETQCYQFEGTDQTIDRLIEGYALPIEKPSPSYEMLRTELLIAQQEYARKALEIDGSYSSYDLSGTPAPQVRSKSITQKHKLADAIEKYKEEKQRLQDWTPSSLLDYQGKFALLLRYLGEEADVEMSSEVALDIKNLLVRLPSRIATIPKLKTMSLEELVQVEGYARLSPSSVNQYLQAYNGFYEWLLRRKQVKENPFKGLLDKVGKTKLKREEFQPDQIERIIRAVMQASKPHHKWGVLIAFYTGARLNEIAQLGAADIVEVENIPCFRFTDTGDDNKRLKNESSKRDIPIHSKLIELGFLDYAKGQRTRLFTGLEYCEKNGYGRNLGRWFNAALLPKLGIDSPSLVFHSIRHTVANRLRNAGVEHATIADILGHTQQTVTMGVYAKNLDKKVMQQAIEKLDYGVVVPQGEDVDPLTLPS